VAVIVPSQPRIKGGAVLTAVGDAPDQALYWELVGLDRKPKRRARLGSLKWRVTQTDASSRRSTSINPLPIRPLPAGGTDQGAENGGVMLELLYTSTKALSNYPSFMAYIKTWDALVAFINLEVHKVFRDGSEAYLGAWPYSLSWKSGVGETFLF